MFGEYIYRERAAPEPFPEMASIGLRRLVFDLGPNGLLLLEALLVLIIKTPKAWKGAIDIFWEMASATLEISSFSRNPLTIFPSCPGGVAEGNVQGISAASSK